MKLIFKNENEENTFWAAAVSDKGVCPSHFGLHEDDSCLGPEPKRCFECWKNSGLETGVKSEPDSTAEFKARLERLRKFIFMICGDDWSELIHEGYGRCVLTPEDVCFLCEIEEEEENHKKPLIGYPEVFTADPDRTVKKKPPLGIMPLDSISYTSTQGLIFVDKETGVQYLFVTSGDRGGLCLLVDSDGKPLLYEGLNKSEE